MSQKQPGLAPQCVTGEDPDVLTFEMPVDELERTVRQRCKCKRLSLLSFSSKETHNGVYSAFAQFSSLFLSDIFHFLLKMPICRVANKQTQKEEQFITLRF